MPVTTVCKTCDKEFRSYPSSGSQYCSYGCYYSSRVKHGGRRTRIYNVWSNMNKRCHNPKSSRYRDYGGRGIYVCQEWRDSFTSFRDWALSHGYQRDLEIDRIDNNGGYSPDNCRFVTRSQNNMNTRKRKNCTSKYRGVTWDKQYKKWRSGIVVKGKKKSLGRFPTQLAAAIAYDNAACDSHAEFALLNFPERKRIFH